MHSPHLLRALGLVALIGVALAGPARAADEAVILKSGEVVGGKVVRLDADILVIDTRRGGKLERREIAIGDLEEGSLYTLKAARVPDGDAAAHLALGEWCLQQDLAYYALRELAKAKQLDPTLAPKADDLIRKAKLARGRHFYTKAVQAMQARDYAEARRLFEIVVKHYPVPFGGPAQKALDHVKQMQAQSGPPANAGGQRPPGAGPGPGQQGGHGQAGQGQQQGGPQQGGQQQGGQRQSVLDPAVHARLNALARQARDMTQAGYFAKTDSRARRAYTDASEVIDNALAILETEARRGRITRVAQARLREPFVRQGADLGINLAIIALRRDNEYAAQKWLARVLLLDPDNERAHELRTYVVTEFRDRNRRRPGKPWLR